MKIEEKEISLLVRLSRNLKKLRKEKGKKKKYDHSENYKQVKLYINTFVINKRGKVSNKFFFNITKQKHKFPFYFFSLIRA